MSKDTLYYDGACPICSAEIAKLAQYTGDKLQLENIHELDDSKLEIDTRQLMSRLHLKTADGEWITGLEANIRAWHHTPFRYLWRMLDWPVIRFFSHRAYEHWLRRRSRSV